MGDVVVLVMIVGLFAVFVGLVALCDRIVGTVDAGPPEQDESREAVGVLR